MMALYHSRKMCAADADHILNCTDLSYLASMLALFTLTVIRFDKPINVDSSLNG